MACQRRAVLTKCTNAKVVCVAARTARPAACCIYNIVVYSWITKPFNETYAREMFVENGGELQVSCFTLCRSLCSQKQIKPHIAGSLAMTRGTQMCVHATGVTVQC